MEQSFSALVVDKKSEDQVEASVQELTLNDCQKAMYLFAFIIQGEL